MRVTGSLIGGNIAEEIIPTSIADFFVVDKGNWIQYQSNLAKGTASKSNGVNFNASRKALISGDYKQSIGAAWGIEHSPEGVFEYTADLALSFSRNKYGKRNAKLKKNARSLQEELPNRWRRTEEVMALRVDTACDGCDCLFNNSINSNAENVCKKRRKLFGAETTSGRESLINNLKAFLQSKSQSDRLLSPYEQSEAMAIHEISFLDTVNGIATSQHIVQTQTTDTKDEVRQKAVLCFSHFPLLKCLYSFVLKEQYIVTIT